jgi:hypothetical protein
VPEEVCIPISYLGRHASSRYIRKLTRCLSGVRFLQDNKSGEGDMYKFRFDGGDGLLMPMRPH